MACSMSRRDKTNLVLLSTQDATILPFVILNMMHKNNFPQAEAVLHKNNILLTELVWSG